MSDARVNHAVRNRCATYCRLSLATVAVLLVTNLASCGGKQKQVTLDPDQLFALQQYVITNSQPADDYIISKFADHDVVILGEFHRIRFNPLLVQHLIPKLYASGVCDLATEFAVKDDQPLIDSLLSSDSWNENLARHIQLNQFAAWPWREYLDIYKVAWELNHSLPDTARPFRILGVNCLLDWSPVQTEEDMNNPAKRREVWEGCNEADWARVVLDAVNAGDKVLAYCGMHHAFTSYRQPRVDGDGTFRGWGDVRFGNHLKDSLGDRVMTISFHIPWDDLGGGYDNNLRRPAGGAIDHVMETVDTAVQLPVGFDVVGGPFAELADPTTLYSAGYENFNLGMFCDGYIYDGPFANTEVVTVIDSFYTDDNIDLARVRVPEVSYRDASPEYFESTMRRQVARQRERWRDL